MENSSTAFSFKLRQPQMDSKWGLLLILMLQNSSLIVILKYSRFCRPEEGGFILFFYRSLEGPKYNYSTTVVLAEVLKLLVSLTMASLNLKKRSSLTLMKVFILFHENPCNYIQAIPNFIWRKFELFLCSAAMLILSSPELPIIFFD